MQQSPGFESPDKTLICKLKRALYGLKQTLVARSSTETEYRSLANTAAEILRLESLLTELQIPYTVQHIYCETKARFS